MKNCHSNKLSKTQVYKITQSGGFLRGMLGSLGNVGKGLGKNVVTNLLFLFLEIIYLD